MPRKPAATKKPAVTKIFVLDTNVLMHDPTSLFRFEEHDVFVPIMTLEELDNQQEGHDRNCPQRPPGLAHARRDAGPR
jgi:PhoH-like ATPase